jgi:hypothetical protein
MQIQLDIQFEQLLQIVRTLPLGQQKLLKVELEKTTETPFQSNLESLLLAGPVATREQLEVIENNRRTLNQWRKK